MGGGHAGPERHRVCALASLPLWPDRSRHAGGEYAARTGECARAVGAWEAALRSGAGAE